MLKIECEYKKGILFVRLMGEFNKSTIKNMEVVDNMIKKAGIRYLLINLEKVTIISHKEISNLIARYKDLIGKDGRLLICGYYHNSNVNLEIDETQKIYLPGREVSAFNIVNI